MHPDRELRDASQVPAEARPAHADLAHPNPEDPVNEREDWPPKSQAVGSKRVLAGKPNVERDEFGFADAASVLLLQPHVQLLLLPAALLVPNGYVLSSDRSSKRARERECEFACVEVGSLKVRIEQHDELRAEQASEFPYELWLLAAP